MTFQSKESCFVSVTVSESDEVLYVAANREKLLHVVGWLQKLDFVPASIYLLPYCTSEPPDGWQHNVLRGSESIANDNSASTAMLREPCCLVLLLVTSTAASSPHIVFIVADDMVSSHSKTFTPLYQEQLISWILHDKLIVVELLELRAFCTRWFSVSSSLYEIKSQINKIHILTLYLFKVQFDVILHFQPLYLQIILFLQILRVKLCIFNFSVERKTTLNRELLIFEPQFKNKKYKVSKRIFLLQFTTPNKLLIFICCI